jgi:NAD-dependent deacetylase
MPSPSSDLQTAAQWLRQARRVVVFTGAGASAESDIPTFRDPGGLWDRFPPEQFATPGGLLALASSQPKRVGEFALGLIEPVAAASPNAGHHAVARLQHRARVTVITQNIDGLHQDAGSSDVLEVHGSLFEIVTLDGHHVRRISRSELRAVAAALRRSLQEPFDPARAMDALKPILSFDPNGAHRPSIVLFGEPMAEPAWAAACEAAADCDCLVSVGTSGAVFPAAMLPEHAESSGAKLIAVGPERTPSHIWLSGTAAGLLPVLVEAVFQPGP